MLIELRQAALVAMGTASDSITFTSNSIIPTPGVFVGLILNGGSMKSKFNYCNFRYAFTGITGGGDSIIVKNSDFSFNTYGYWGGTPAILDSSNFAHNVTFGASFVNSTVNYCTASYNGVGLRSSTNGNRINHCIINNNQTGIGGDGSLGAQGFSAHHCSINYNQTGVDAAMSCRVYNCNVIGNQTGIKATYILQDGLVVNNTIIDSNAVVGINISNRGDSIYSCQIKFNGVGIIDNNIDNFWQTYITKNAIENNAIGLELLNTPDNISCNKICNNISYDLKYTGNTSFSLPNNYFCTPDSASTAAVVYDGYDNINLGLLNFMPLDNVCYLTIPDINTGVSSHDSPFSSFNIYPNPITNVLNINLGNYEPTEIILYDLSSRKVLQVTFTNTTTINTEQLAKGMYLYELRNKNGVIKNGKVIKQ